MKRIGIISDTHGFVDLQMINILQECDEIWHAGDFGYNNSIEKFIRNFNIKGVYGNIDGQKIRNIYPRLQTFHCEEVKVLMTHICGNSKNYTLEIEQIIQLKKPNIFICGHSHILKIKYDKKYDFLHINPGSAGKEGFHIMRTLVLLEINDKKIYNIKVVELGKRSQLSNSIY